jgi:hypothetical protein
MTAALIPELALRITVGLLFLGWLVLCDTSEVTPADRAVPAHEDTPAANGERQRLS